MLSTKYKYISVLIFILFIPFLIIVSQNGFTDDSPNSSTTYFYKIDLRSNQDLDEFVAGNGTTGLNLESAHVIENFSIHSNSEEYGIYLQNIDRYLIIRNSLVYATDTAFSEKSGIEIRMSSNIFIQNCSILYYKEGIQLIGSFYCTITNSTSANNSGTGIKLIESDNNIIDNNTVIKNHEYGIYLKRSNENSITNNFIEENYDLGIFDKGNYNIFENNTCEPITKKPIFNKIWLWIILGVGGAVFFIGGLMAYVTWRGR